MMISAVRRLASEEEIAIDQAIARRVVDRQDIRTDLWVWLYVFELHKRSIGKGKGRVDHSIWKAIPSELRRNMNADLVWNARCRIVSEIKKIKTIVDSKISGSCTVQSHQDKS